MFFVSFFHVICKISNFNVLTAKHLAQASCTELTLMTLSCKFSRIKAFQNQIRGFHDVNFQKLVARRNLDLVNRIFYSTSQNTLPHYEAVVSHFDFSRTCVFQFQTKLGCGKIYFRSLILSVRNRVLCCKVLFNQIIENSKTFFILQSLTT